MTPDSAEPSATAKSWVVGIIDAVTAPSSARPDDRTWVATCVQHAPIPPPTSRSDAAIARMGPGPIVRKRPTNPAAESSGPSTIVRWTRAAVTRVLSSVAAVHERDWVE